MSRSNWKTPFIDKSLLKRLTPQHEKKPTWSRRSTIYPAAVGLKLQIYNGKDMISRKIKPEMVGHKLGEFVATRKNFIAKKKKITTTKKK
uniref:Small ribosomal subunit protein uS19c n=1 Tax=Alaria crispa TaxID=441892 RepID=A0A8E8PEH6_9PHAE|nr:ribosomal protein S19 [Alaria marginata]QWE51039.1 ribosomal protein S19 [Alaria crispa]UAX19632.1 ribosomal protein S19 [Alaria crispa]UAX19670.1 ribosomal protein S19 [Alaria crispa]UAX19708.1 ribosomal protein S19 [Alaria marginata]UAX19784.1 ribosomal protein S19 [Alaria marginata]